LDNGESQPNESSALTTDSAVEAFAAILDPTLRKEETPEVVAEKLAEEAVTAEPDNESTESEDDPTVTIKIDGKDVEVKLSELKNGYQRQADYTRKTMEVSETRKAAESQIQAAQAERQAYAVNLQKMQAQIEGALQQQQQIDWAQLLESDPVEYLKQQHLLNQRQAAYQQNIGEQQKLAALFQADQQRMHSQTLQAQQDALLAKLPEWKDETKAKADKTALRDYLLKEGYEREAVDGISDARAVLLARKAMLYDSMMDKARAAAKKVSTLPQKVERPGVGQVSLDKRSQAFQRLSKSGSVDDAAAVFRNFV
jgi:hypothetical protein